MPWVSQVIMMPKPRSLVNSDYLDMKEANCTIKHENHPMPTIEGKITALNRATVFSTLDLKQGYHQFELIHPDSLYMYIPRFQQIWESGVRIKSCSASMWLVRFFRMLLPEYSQEFPNVRICQMI